ncbi:putative cytochrome C, class I [Magnetofaba australis IT-1]|uniref:Putative cytochrome C, class I n=2 Tax=Magnetofaba TaxID=1472292 RepID=A0A1Y2K223_9PROT|nr:putative cytochrome C, class I [Magnetofaba australis IT-1]
MIAGGVAMNADEARADMASGLAMANTCAGCHGTDGMANGPAMPNIAGQPANYLIPVMKEFRSGERYSTIMGRIAKGYSDAEIEALSKAVAGWKWTGGAENPKLAMKTGETIAMVKPALAAEGEKLAKEMKCTKCHEDGGKSTEDDMPRVAGQHLDYLLFKMEDYKDEALKMPQPKKMKKRMDKASAKELEAISHFWAANK